MRYDIPGSNVAVSRSSTYLAATFRTPPEPDEKIEEPNVTVCPVGTDRLASSSPVRSQAHISLITRSDLKRLFQRRFVNRWKIRWKFRPRRNKALVRNRPDQCLCS